MVWLEYSRAKSHVKAKVALLKRALALLKKYELKKDDIPRKTIFPYVSNKDLNTNLKIIGEICEFGISLNFYTA